MLFAEREPDTTMLEMTAPAIRGPDVSAGDAFSQMFRQTSQVDSALGPQNSFLTRYRESIRGSREAGIYLPPLTPSVAASLMAHYTGQVDLTDETTPPEGIDPRAAQVAREVMRTYNLYRQQTNVPSLEAITADVVQEMQQIETTTERMAARSGASGTVGMFAGGMAGSFTLNDPVNLMTLPLGGFGRTVVGRVMTESVVQGTIETANQFGNVMGNREMLGLDEGDEGMQRALTGIAFAAAGGAALRGLFEAAPPAVRALRGGEAGIRRREAARLEQEQARRIVDNLVMLDHRQPGTLEAFVRAIPGDSPMHRAIRNQAEALSSFWRRNPFTTTRAHREAATAILREMSEDADAARAGQVPPRRDTTERVQEPVTEPVQERRLTPEERDRAMTVETQQEQDALWRLRSEINADAQSLRTLSERIEALETVPLDTLVSDERAAALVRQLDEAEAAGDFATAAARITDLERLEVEEFPTVRQDAIAALREDADLRRANLRRVRTVAKEKTAALAARRKELAAQLEERTIPVPTERGRPLEDVTVPGLALGVDPPARAAQVEARAAQVDPALEATTARIRATKDEDLVDIGADNPVQKNFTFEAVDDDGTSRTMDIEELLEELDAQQEIIQATQVCAR